MEENDLYAFREAIDDAKSEEDIVKYANLYKKHYGDLNSPAGTFPFCLFGEVWVHLPLHYALVAHRTLSVRVLIGLGADPLAKDVESVRVFGFFSRPSPHFAPPGVGSLGIC